MFRPPASASPGFTLVEMAIVLAIIGLISAVLLSFGSGFIDNEKRKNVRVRLDTAEAALINFVVVNKRLPCPADGRIASGTPGAGTESINVGPGTCTLTVAQFGVLPWVTLGMAEADASDPWNARLSYRVDPNLAAALPKPLLMNMSDCDPASTGAVSVGGGCKVPVLPCTGSAGCTSPAAFLAAKGLDVWDGLNGAPGFAARQNNSTTGSGAAWVLISHGPSGAGAYSANGTLQPGDAQLPPSKDLEDHNLNALVLAKPATSANVYIDGALNDNPQAYVPPPPVPVPAPPPRTLLHFDDYLSHPTLISVLTRANLGPRAH